MQPTMSRIAGILVAVNVTLALLAAPLAAEAQPAGKVYRIGVLYPGADNSIFRGNFDGFRQALRTAGYVEGRNLAFEAGAIAVKILARTPPAEIPVERPTRFTLSLNIKTAHALGLTIPPLLLLRADEVIQ
jgi:putative ABC transport system substrate-binding protein